MEKEQSSFDQKSARLAVTQTEKFAPWQQQAQAFWEQGNYAEAAQLYEQAIATEPNQRSYYWQLGLLLLLQEQETEAQTVWFVVLAEAEPEQMEAWSLELVQVLDAEAERREQAAEYAIAWAIRQHIREIYAAEIKNVLHLVWLAVQLKTLTAEDLHTLGIIELLKADPKPDVESGRVLQILDQVLKFLPPNPVILDFTEACLSWVDDLDAFMGVLLPAAFPIAYQMHYPKLAADLLELYLRLDPDSYEVITHLSMFYQNASCFDKGIKTAQRCYEIAQDDVERLAASHIVIRAYMSAGGYWQDAVIAMDRHKQLMRTIIAEHPLDLPPVQITRLMTACCFLPYFTDNLAETHSLQNQLMGLCQENGHLQAQERVTQYQARNAQARATKLHPTQSQSRQPLKIGYISHCMGSHSVGWLARWLIKHHDRDQVQLYGYFINERKNDALFTWYTQQMKRSYQLNVKDIDAKYVLADQINQDGVDILVDLDSLTLDITCHTVALKPAPVQVSWLGWDASGIPAIDYFIADPYVLPDWAQEHYSEKIWRLPQTYIAVDGFETDVPSLRRDQLDIPADAIVYLSAQKGYKRHADTVRLQMKIIKEVPNSYFLIKGQADQESIKPFFAAIAEAEGVSLERLRFLPETALEGTHRANLAIADVILDTFPYNGATTTLETLWMGVPLVTRVGEQFAARNSYTMLKNVGVEEGIAWTDEEYIEWGVRLGKDEALRQQIHWKLRQSRHTSPLWNAQQFTREMEKAYSQMWQIYSAGKG
jgi:predicted O-linked N-acetylglucosamine transferase (SPINDLY family)